MRLVFSVDWDWFTGAINAFCNPGLCGWKCRQFGPVKTRRPSYNRLKWRRIWRSPARRIRSFFEFAKIDESAKFFVAENHASIMEVLKKGDQVFDWDFHLDSSGQEKLPPLYCGSWRDHAAAKGVVLFNQYQPRKPKRSPRPATLVFLCRSSPWTPYELDPVFNEFISTIEDRCIPPKFIGSHALMLKNEYRVWRKARDT